MSIKRKLNYAFICLFWILATTTMHILAQTPSPEPQPLAPEITNTNQINIILKTTTEATQTAAPGQNSGAFANIFVGDPFTGGTQIAIDSTGGYHMATHDLIGDYPGDTVYYGYCASGCASPANWGFIDVYTDDKPLSKPINVRLELDPLDRPRLAWIQDLSLDDDYVVYVECNANCLNTNNWVGSYIVSDGGGFAFHYNNNSSRWFTLDNQGQPRFAYIYDAPLSDGEIFYGYCNSNCASAASWVVATIASTTAWDPTFSLDFTGNHFPRLAAVADGELYYLSCDVSCGSAGNWQITFIAEQIDESIQLTLDSQDRPRIARYYNSNAIMYDWCNSGCQDANNWNHRALTAFPQHSGLGIDLLFDSQNRPHMAFVGNGSSLQMETGYAHCLNACDTPDTTVWAYNTVERDVHIPEIPLVNSCNIQAWDMDGPVSIALNTEGQVVFGYTAVNYQFDTLDPTWNCVYELDMQGPDCTGTIHNPLCFLPVALQYPRLSIPLDNIVFLPILIK